MTDNHLAALREAFPWWDITLNGNVYEIGTNDGDFVGEVWHHEEGPHEFAAEIGTDNTATHWDDDPVSAVYAALRAHPLAPMLRLPKEGAEVKRRWLVAFRFKSAVQSGLWSVEFDHPDTPTSEVARAEIARQCPDASDVVLIAVSQLGASSE